MKVTIKRIISPTINKKDRIPPGQYVETDHWPVLHDGTVPDVDLKDWRFRIFGLVEKEVELSYEEFMELPRVEVLSDIHCVTGWSVLDNIWEGIPSVALRDIVSIKDDARFVMIHAEGNFTTNIPIDDFFQEDVLFAYKRNGSYLSREHGFPLRLIVPRLYFWKSAKWVRGVEFMKQDRPGYWEMRGYHMHGDPWLEERYG